LTSPAAGVAAKDTTLSPKAILAVVVLVAVLIGGNFTALKFALDHSTPLLIAGMRTVIGGTFLLGFAWFRGERFPTNARDWFNIFMVSLSITTISSGFLVYGVNRVTAGVASLIASTMPMFTAVLALVLMKTAVSRLAVAGLAVGFAGTLVLASPSFEGSTATIGIVSLLIAAIAWAFGNVYMKWQDMTNVSPIMLVGLQLYMSAICLVPFALVVEGTGETDWSIGLFAPLLYAAIPANAVTFALLATVVRRATPTQAASTAYLIPLFGVFFGWLIRDERLGLIELGGGLFIIVGVYMLVTATARQSS